MMSANAVLMKFFKLPPAVRMMLALAGFGSLATILFTLLPSLRTSKGRLILLIVFGVGLVLFLIFWGIKRLFFRKKSSELSEALESQGPTRGDIAEQEQIYREKFRGKLADLKTNGLSAYKLPWFVLIGEPGCGKTASLIHSGLDFPLGKDEVPGFGGTRNYNWWFSNEAVILDTAGRIAFQEEGTTDKVEWEYFLKLLKTHRQRCPVNGVVIAVPADKLLRDNSEERAQKAAVLRERLRQVHQSLGVRFPTFVLVTKMDLVGGFSEFFEEIRVDLRQRNQMCGWSRPGEFQAPYDPATFPEAFDEVYYRLRNWEMRYLQRKATEDELGMIVTFPESFRQLRDPLHDYVSTIFQKSPLLEPPFFRGFYFTSAVQEGAPIFDVFTKSKAGIKVAERPTKAVDSKAFFIHDLYADKVFPEHGLVFRSAKHVSLNKRMRRVVWVGSAAMLLLLVGVFILGTTGVHGLIRAPREMCATATEAIKKKGDATFNDLSGNLRIAKSLQEYYEAYSRPWTAFHARLLFVGANIRVPQGCVGKIHARFVLDCIFRPVMAQVAKKVADSGAAAATTGEARARYIEALRVYTQWYGEVVGQHELKELDKQEAAQRRTELEALLTFLGLPDADRYDVAEQFDLALTTLSAESRSFAREILRDTTDFNAGGATDAIVAAVNGITGSWKPLTQLSADNTNPMVRYWASFTSRVGALRERYADMLALADGFSKADEYERAVARFLKLAQGVEHLGDPGYRNPEPGSLHEAYYNLMTFLDSEQVPETAEHKIIRLSGLLALFEAQWSREFTALQQALEIGAPDRAQDPQSQVYTALARGQADLATAFRRSLIAIRGRLGLPENAEPLDYYINCNLVRAEEANPPTPFDRPAEVKLAREALGVGGGLTSYLSDLRAMVGGQAEELKALEKLQNWPGLLEGLRAAKPAGKSLGSWFDDVEQAGFRDDFDKPTATDTIRQKSMLRDHAFWQPVDLFRLARQMWKARQANSTGLLLARMAEKAAATTQVAELPGLARLMPGFEQPSSLPFDYNRFNIPQVAPAQPEETVEEPEEEEVGEGLRRLRRARKPVEPTERLEREKSTALLFEYHTRDFLLKTLRQFERVRAALKGYPGAEKVATPLAAAADAYIDAYFVDWYEVYSDPTRLLNEQTLAFIQKCGQGALSWPEYVDALGQDENDFGRALADRMEKLVRHVVMFDAALQEAESEEAIWNRITARLSELNRQRRSIPDLARSMRRNVPPAAAGDPEVVYARQLSSAWREYVKELRGLGPLTDEARRSSGEPPDLEKLAEEIVYQQSATTSFPLVAPLIDIAEFGQDLLIYHLDTKLTDLFAAHAGAYPLIYSADALDDSALLTRVSERQTMDPDALLELLRQVAEFQARYGVLYSDVRRDSAAHRTLHSCEAWTRFLYEDPEALTRGGKPPHSLKLSLEICRDRSGKVGSAARVYSTLRVTLPILSESGGVAPALVRRVRAGEDIPYGSVQQVIGNRPLEYRWDLFAGGRVSFEPMTAVVSDKHPGALEAYPARAPGWILPGSPWSLLMAMGARQDNDLGDGYWQIPVRMETGVDPIGFVIGLRLGSRERPFPGAIPPLGQSGPLPKMANAAHYLSSPSP